MLSLVIHAINEGSDQRLQKKLHNTLTRVICNVATFISRMNHQRKYFIVEKYHYSNML